MSKCNSAGVSARLEGAGVPARGALLPPSRAKCSRSHLPGAVRFYKLPEKRWSLCAVSLTACPPAREKACC